MPFGARCDIDGGAGCMYVETGAIWKLSLLSAQFCYKLKIAFISLKTKTIIFHPFLSTIICKQGVTWGKTKTSLLDN